MAALADDDKNCRKSAITRPSTTTRAAPRDRLACPPVELAGSGVPNEPLRRVVPACVGARTDEAVLVTLPDCCPLSAIEQPHTRKINAIEMKQRMILRPG